MAADADTGLLEELAQVLIAKGLARPPSKDKAAARRRRGIETGLVRVQDRRRFRQNAVPTGEAKVEAPADAAGTIFPSTVSLPVGERVLKDGASNAKTGGDVLVGPLEGARIVTLTVEERATCPRSCALWRTCYGNAMPYATRWRHGPELLARIAAELDELCAAHLAVLVRLHVLGDFWSTEYVDFWRSMLWLHPNLHAFGFTAHGPDTPIGSMIAELRADSGRFAIRHSGRGGEWGSFTIDFPTERARVGDAVVCPEQRDAMKGSPRGMHCGACGLCWKGAAPIVFVEH